MIIGKIIRNHIFFNIYTQALKFQTFCDYTTNRKIPFLFHNANIEEEKIKADP